MPIIHQDFIKNSTSFKFYLSNALPSNIPVTSVGNIIILDSSYIINYEDSNITAKNIILLRRWRIDANGFNQSLK